MPWQSYWWAWVAGAVWLAAGAVACPLLRAQSVPPPGSNVQLLFERLNRERERVGLPTLSWDEDLAAAAHRHSQAMADRRELTHQNEREAELQERLKAVPLDRAGENVAVGPTLASVHNGLMQSPPHRENIMNPRFDAIGIGIVQRDDSYWVTQDFARLLPMLDAQSAAELVAQALAKARTRERGRPLRRLDSMRMQQLACAMGEAGHPDAKAVLNTPGAQRGLAYSTSDPKRVPESVSELAQTQGVDSYAVAACFSRSPRYPSGTYWIALVLFHGGW